MTENSPTNIESLSLEVEQARLDIELIRQSNDDHRVSLERWNTALRPIHEKYIQSRAQSVAFATLGIRSMFLLNGGALLVFPAFAKLLGTGFVEQMGWAQWSIGCFVVGLITIALTTVLAYLSSDLRSMALEYESSRTHLFLLRSQVLAKSEEEPYPEQEIAALSGTEDKANRWATRVTQTALVVGILSLVAFALGAVMASSVLTGGECLFFGC